MPEPEKDENCTQHILAKLTGMGADGKLIALLAGLLTKHDSEGEINTRRNIIGSIFPEKLEFDGKTYRTTRMNVIANYIFQINNGLPQKRTGQTKINFNCPV